MASDPATRLLPLLLALGLGAAVEGCGLGLQVEAWARREIAAWRDPVPRGAAPVVLAIDAAAVEAFGPPPWDDATWARVAGALARAGVGEIVAADPWPRLWRPGAGADGLPVRVLVPAAVGDGRPVLPPPVPWEAHPRALAFTPTPSGIAHTTPLVGVALPPHDGTWRWTARPVDLPVVGLRDVVDGRVGALDARGLPVLVGVTDPVFADRVDHDADPTTAEVPAVLHLASAWAGFALGEVHRVPGLGARLLGLAVAAALSRWRAWAGGLAVLGALVAGLPVTTPVVGALVPAVTAGIATLVTAVLSSRRLHLLAGRLAARSGVLRRRVQGDAGLLDALVEAARAVGAHRAALVRHGEVRALPGLPVAEGPVPSAGAPGEVKLRPSGVVVTLALPDGPAVWWLQAPRSRPVDPELVARLAAQVQLRAQMDTGAVDVSSEALLTALDADRTRLLQAVRRLPAPVLVADPTGRIDVVSNALEARLTAAGVDLPRQVGELPERGPAGRVRFVHLTEAGDAARVLGQLLVLEGAGEAAPWPVGPPDVTNRAPEEVEGWRTAVTLPDPPAPTWAGDAGEVTEESEAPPPMAVRWTV